MQAAIGSLSNISIASLKNSIDEVRAQVYPRNDTEKKVYEALSSKNWGASTTLMNEIANDTGDYEKFAIIMSLIWSSIETDGKSWKQVFKALTLIEFLVKNGSERVIEACRDKIYKIRSLENFNFYEGTLDRGSGVREKSKQIVELLGSNEMIRTEREKASSLRNKFVGIGNDGSRGSTGSVSSGNNYSGGGSGGGSYSGDRGFGTSYSDSHSNSNGGGHDNYSSNSNSRYIHDSYDANRGGGGSGGSGSNGKYRDDEPKYSTETIAAPRKKSYDEDEEDVKVKHKSKSTSKLAAPTSDVAVGGKLKLNIKKGGQAAAAAPAPVQQASMLDFMDGGDSDFMSAPAAQAPVVPSNSNMFDAFSSPATSAQDDFGFATFSAAPPAPVPQQQAQAQAFDPFGMGSPPAHPQSQPVMQFSQQQFQQPPPIPQDSFGQFSSPMQAPPVPQQPMMQPAMMQQQQAPMIPQQMFGQFSSPMQAPPVPQSSMMQPMQQPAMQQQQYQQPMGYSAPSIPQSAPIPQQQQQQQQQQQPQIFRGIVAKAPEPVHAEPAAAQVPAGKWGDIGGLVNLGGISKNESLVAKQQAAAASNYTPSSFSGLDGFSKSQGMSSTPMNMVRQAPLQQQQYQQQQQPPMGGAMSGGYNGMQGQGPGMSQPQYQGYGMPGASGAGGMQPNRGMAPPTPQFSAPQGQYNQMGMQQQQQQQQQQQAPNMMGMGMGMGMQPQGQAPRGMMPPNVPSYGYPTQGQNGNYQ